jgi:hypothetical protein
MEIMCSRQSKQCQLFYSFENCENWVKKVDAICNIFYEMSWLAASLNSYCSPYKNLKRKCALGFFVVAWQLQFSIEGKVTFYPKF